VGTVTVFVARSFRHRLVGLIGRRSLPADYAVLFPDCDSVHTAWMRMPIDVVFLDAGGAALEVRRSLAPWRVARCRGAAAVLECRAGAADALLSARWCRAARPA
jgi:uncharacterized membrane protein (UPF0127 family)